MLQSAPSLRCYRSSDLNSLVTLDSLCFDEVFRFSKQAMRRFAEARNATTTIAGIAGLLAGFSIVHNERVGGEKIAYLTTLDVHPKFRRQGIAGALMDAASERAARQLCTAMHLHVFRANTGALAFYERVGFMRQASIANFYGQHLHAYFYQKPLMRVEIASATATGLSVAS